MADEGESDGRSVLTPSRERLSTRLWLSLISCRQVKRWVGGALLRSAGGGLVVEV